MPFGSSSTVYLPDASCASVENTLAVSTSPLSSAPYCRPSASWRNLALSIPYSFSIPTRPVKRLLNSGRAPSEKLDRPLRSATDFRLFSVANSFVVAIASTSWNGVGPITACPRFS